MQAVAIIRLLDRYMQLSSKSGDCTAEETVRATDAPKQKQTEAKEQPARPAPGHSDWFGQSRIYIDGAGLLGSE